MKGRIILTQSKLLFYKLEQPRCEDYLAAISSPMTTRVDSANVAVQAGVPSLPACSTCILPEAMSSVKGKENYRIIQKFHSWASIQRKF